MYINLNNQQQIWFNSIYLKPPRVTADNQKTSLWSRIITYRLFHINKSIFQYYKSLHVRIIFHFPNVYIRPWEDTQHQIKTIVIVISLRITDII